MRNKVREKVTAIKLRKKGCSYGDILKKVPVARSSLSLWLKDLPLTKEEKKVLKQRRDSSISKGRIKAAAAQRRKRDLRVKHLFLKSKGEFIKHQNSKLFHTGVALYWAEGAKRNKYFSFSNSDIEMIILMLDWMERFLFIDRKEVRVNLYIHKPYAHENCEAFWAEKIGVSRRLFKKTIYKLSPSLVKKRPHYKGVLRISTNMEHLRKMKFWTQMLIEYHKQV